MIKGIFLLFITAVPTIAKSGSAYFKTDSTIAYEIQIQLADRQTESSLYFPNSVKRFYMRRTYATAWLSTQNETGRTWQAMLMLDCVLQFGLSHKDFHPDELLYDRLHRIMEQPITTPASEKAHFDILLTDAIITFLNYLHYGKLNPNYSDIQIDEGLNHLFTADSYLNSIIEKPDLMLNIAAAQPQNKLYADMQEQLHLLKGLYLDDCYEVPEADVRKLAINMERLRWENANDTNYIRINIPSYTLTYNKPDTTYRFKVVVGKASTPTPTLSSVIRYFTTAPDWRVPQQIFVKEILPKALADTTYLQNNHFTMYNNRGQYVNASTENLKIVKKHPKDYHATQSAGCDNALGLVVFRFDNPYDIYLHDTPEQNLFNVEKRDFSHGCIRVEQAVKLAGLLLERDHTPAKTTALYQAVATLKTVNFVLKKAMPIKISYLTCEMRDGELIMFNDVYHLDSSLEIVLYGAQ